MRLQPFLNEMLELLREDYPEHLEQMERDGMGVNYLQVLDREKAVIKFGKRGIMISGKAGTRKIDIRVYISRECLFGLLEGKLTLEEAFYREELRVFGDPSTLLRCYGIWERLISLARKSPRFYFLTYKLR